MHGEHRKRTPGFTLVEILVVLAVIAVISAIAIPGLAKLGAFSRDEFKRTVIQVDSLLRAAQIYSTTYHVNTAVVYSLDQWSQWEATGAVGTDPAPYNPIVDSLTGAPVRQIEAAAIMYQLPSTFGNVANAYVPIPGEAGEFQPLPFGMSLLLQHPESDLDADLEPDPVYLETTSHNYQPGAPVNAIGEFGMSTVTAAIGLPVEATVPEFLNFIANPANFVQARFPAHVFTPAGRVAVASVDRERFTLYIAPGADRPLDERLVEPEYPNAFLLDGSTNLLHRKLYLHKSTARTSVPDAF